MDYIEISGYKSIKNARIDLRPVNILIGANGAGKSNLLSVFDFLYHLYSKKLREFISLQGGEEKFLHKGAKTTDSISIKTEFGKSQNGYHCVLKSGDGNLIFTEEYLYYQAHPGSNIANFSGESCLHTTDNLRAKHVLEYLKSYQKYHFHDTGKNSPFTKLSHFEKDIYYLYHDGHNLAAFLYNIKESDNLRYNLIVQAVQSIAPFFSDFYLEPNKEGFIRLLWQNKFSSNLFGTSDFSDGTMRFIVLAVLFLQPSPPQTIIIDEPELGLHPFAIAKLAGLIHSAVARNTQVVIATQSADLLNYFNVEDIITVDQFNGESSFNRLSLENFSHWLEDYKLSELWQQNILASGYPI